MPVKYNSDLTHETVSALLNYNPESGVLAWKVRSSSRRGPGDSAGSLHRFGYIIVRVGGKAYKAHRLAWLLHYGKWPEDQVDHVNGDRADNRIANLRAATASENGQNLHRRKTGATGFLGVTQSKGPRSKTLKFQAQIQSNGEYFYLGRFSTPEEAHAAYLEAKANLHEFQPVPRGS
jgi:hypothetical protein